MLVFAVFGFDEVSKRVAVLTIYIYIYVEHLFVWITKCTRCTHDTYIRINKKCFSCTLYALFEYRNTDIVSHIIIILNFTM